ncbi:MAG: pectin acetylesterase-family hydrolase [Pseudomonadota bacterium]
MLFSKRAPRLIVLLSTILLVACDGDDGQDGAPGTRGSPGADGADGLSSLLVQTDLPIRDDNCPNGGVRIDSGIDGNRDGLLQTDEIDQTSFVCNGGEPPPPFAELFEQGVGQYLGQFTPMMSSVGTDGVTEHVFGTGAGGPQCLRGTEYRMAVRDGSGEDLMIFLEGGGACTSQLCAAREEASNDLFRLGVGINSPADAENPAADFDVAYFPYCDGSVFSGDQDYDDDGDGALDRFHRGVQNLSAGLDVVVAAYPSPSSILLTGNSAGGYGTNYALPLVRRLWPDVPIRMLNDSGVGIAFPGYTQFVSTEWNSLAYIPESCPTCINEDGHTTEYTIYQLNEDPNLITGFMSTAQDTVIADDFLQIGGPAFEQALRAEMPVIEAAHPDRFRFLIVAGSDHTFIQRAFDLSVGNTTIKEWVADMLANNSDWVSISEE